MAMTKGKITASVVEVVLRQLMEKAGRGNMLQSAAANMSTLLGNFGARSILDGASLVGGTMGKIGPLRGLIAPIFQFAGFEGEEAVDIAGAVLSAVGEGLPEGMSEGLDEAEIQRRAEEQFGTLTAAGGKLHGAFTKLTTDPATAARATEVFAKNTGTAAAPIMTFHHISCPECQPEIRQGKKGTPPKEVPRARKITLGFALDNAYGPTPNDCCRRSLEKLITESKRKNMRLDQVIVRLPADAPARQIFNLLCQNPNWFETSWEEFQRIRQLNVWQETDADFAAEAILRAVQPNGTLNTGILLDGLHGKIPAPKGIRETVSEGRHAFREAVDAFREPIKEAADGMSDRRKRTAAQLEIARRERGE